MICLSSFNNSFMPCLPLSFAISSLPCSPPMTSAPLGVLCPHPGCFFRPSHLHTICSLDSNLWCAEMAVYLLVLIKGSPLCDLCCWVTWSLSALPLLCPSPTSLPGFPGYHYGNPIWCDTCVCYFSQLPILQLRFQAPSRAANEVPTPAIQVFDDMKFQEACFSLPIPAFKYTPLLPSMFCCLLV